MEANMPDTTLEVNRNVIGFRIRKVITCVGLVVTFYVTVANWNSFHGFPWLEQDQHGKELELDAVHSVTPKIKNSNLATQMIGEFVIKFCAALGKYPFDLFNSFVDLQFINAIVIGVATFILMAFPTVVYVIFKLKNQLKMLKAEMDEGLLRENDIWGQLTAARMQQTIMSNEEQVDIDTKESTSSLEISQNFATVMKENSKLMATLRKDVETMQAQREEGLNRENVLRGELAAACLDIRTLNKHKVQTEKKLARSQVTNRNLGTIVEEKYKFIGDLEKELEASKTQKKINGTNWRVQLIIIFVVSIGVAILIQLLYKVTEDLKMMTAERDEALKIENDLWDQLSVARLQISMAKKLQSQTAEELARAQETSGNYAKVIEGRSKIISNLENELVMLAADNDERENELQRELVAARLAISKLEKIRVEAEEEIASLEEAKTNLDTILEQVVDEELQSSNAFRDQIDAALLEASAWKEKYFKLEKEIDDFKYDLWLDS